MSGSEMVGILMVEWAMRQTVYLPDVPEPGPGEDMAEKVAPKSDSGRCSGDGRGLISGR